MSEERPIEVGCRVRAAVGPDMVVRNIRTGGLTVDCIWFHDGIWIEKAFPVAMLVRVSASDVLAGRSLPAGLARQGAVTMGAPRPGMFWPPYPKQRAAEGQLAGEAAMAKAAEMQERGIGGSYDRYLRSAKREDPRRDKALALARTAELDQGATLPDAMLLEAGYSQDEIDEMKAAAQHDILMRAAPR